MRENVVQLKSYEFAKRIVKLYKYLVEERHEYVLAKQVVHCGTSIGANVEEAIGAQTDKDFTAKLYIAYKEARETHYWLRLLRDTDVLKAEYADSILTDCDELLRLLATITKTMKDKQHQSIKN